MIRRLRKKLGLTQKEMAKKLGVTVSTVTKWECNGFVPRGTTLLKLAKLLDTTVDSIVRSQARKKARA